MNDADLNQAPRGHATMMDVARVAGVSLKSVSRVINNEPHVSEKLKEKIQAAIAQLDYVPDTAARSLAGARSFTIGVLFDKTSPNYAKQVIDGAYRACMEQQYHLRFDMIPTDLDEAQLHTKLDAMFRNARCDGFVLTPPICDDERVLRVLELRGIRYARIAPLLDPGRSMAVEIDDAGAAAQLADTLYDLGHRVFGLANGPAHHGAARTRRQGFVERLRQRDPHVVIHEVDGGFHFEIGIAAGHALLGQAQRPTAIFAGNDDCAAGIMVAAREMGVSVPGDLSVCGFDDSWVAKTVWPYLTTVMQPVEDMAYHAALMVIEREPRKGQARTMKLDFALIHRDSVGPVPAA